MIKTILTCFAIAIAPAALAQTPGFTPESLSELRRVFGTTPQPSPEILATQRAADISNLTRVLTQPDQSAIAAFVALNDAATPLTIDSLTLLSALANPTSDPAYFLMWHQISLDATAIDHAAEAEHSSRHQEQQGPPRASRALAIVHLAMFEAANVFDHRYQSRFPATETLSVAGASRDAAIVEAAYATMAWLYPGLEPRLAKGSATNLPTLDCLAATPPDEHFSLSAYHACSLARLGETKPETIRGREIGGVIAALVIASRLNDKANEPEPTFDKDSVLDPASSGSIPAARWTIDPVSTLVTQLGGRWGDVTPFAPGIDHSLYPSQSPQKQYLPTDPAKLATLPSFGAVRSFGMETRFGPNPAPINHDGLFVTQFWAYDGTASLCAPPRLYNQIALAALSHLEATPADAAAAALDPANTADVARYFALLNVGMSDAAIAAWGAKYTYQFARPITYIRAADQLAAANGTESVGPLWLPIGAQNTNAAKPFNITPPFPSYPSGHAVFGGTVFGIMRQFIKPNAAFTFRSDEFNGHNRDAFNYIRCNPTSDGVTPALFCDKRKLTVDCAERENADSRVFMGVHWLFDADDGITMGNKVAKQVFTLFQRIALPDSAARFSVNPPASATPKTVRATLVCDQVRFPAGWEAAFGDLTVTPVN